MAASNMTFSTSSTALLAVVVLCFLLGRSECSTYPVNTDGVGHRFDGLGGLSGGGATSRLLPDYVEPQRSEILDFMFEPNFGLSMHILKVEIGGDGQSTQGTEASHMHSADDENYHRGYEWWLMKQAKQRNPNIKLYGLSWAYPAWVGEGGSQPFTNSTLRYIISWLNGAKQYHNLDIDYIGLWNERAYDRTYTLALRDAIKQSGLQTVIVAADSCPPYSWMWSICDRVVDDPEWANAFEFVGSHYVNANTTDNCRKLGKPLWESEGLWADYHDGSCWSRVINRNYVYANITATIAWNANAAYLRGLPDEGTGLMASPSPWSGYYGVDKVVWSTSHTTHFTQPGWTYLKHDSGVGQLDGGGTYVSLTDGHDLTIVVESMVGDHTNCQHETPPSTPVSEQVAVFELAGAVGSRVKQLHVFHSSMTDDSTDEEWFVYEGRVAVINNRFNLTLLPNQLYTFSTLNSTKGSFPDSPVPRETPFPSHYSDDFNSYAVHQQPRYLTDQSGSFEIVQSSDATHGRVLRQMVPAKPIAWCDESPLAYTVVGSHEWRAMNASVQVYIEDSNSSNSDVVAFLATSVTDGGCMGGAGSTAIVLAVAANGTFIISNSTGLQAIVDAGSVDVSAGEWHELRILVDDGGGSFYVDGALVSHVRSLSTSFAAGWVGLGGSYDHIQYDNLYIQAGSAEAADEQCVTCEAELGELPLDIEQVVQV